MASTCRNSSDAINAEIEQHETKPRRLQGCTKGEAPRVDRVGEARAARADDRAPREGVLGAEKLAELAKDVLGTLAQLRTQLAALEAQRVVTYDTLQQTVVRMHNMARRTSVSRSTCVRKLIGT